VKNISIALVLFCVSGGIAQGQPGLKYEAIRINNSQPIITQALFTGAGVPDEGKNINGPTVIRIPDWIAPENRANPDAMYYIYFAHHSGDYIRMAWAKEIEGPWHLYNIGSEVELGNRGVLDHGNKNIYLDNGIMISNNHLASLDAHVDHENQQVILYFHSGSSTYVNGVQVKKQLSYVSTSPDGLHFYDSIEPVFFGPSYFRVFKYKQNLYALTNDGTPYRALDAEFPWTPPAGFNFTNYLWEKHSDNPFQRDITNDGIEKSVLRVRHTAVRVTGDELQIFYSRRGDSPERIQMSTIDLSVGDWEKWDATYPPTELLRAISGWEGGQFTPKPSETSSAPENVNQLRDPYVFEDNDSLLYLFYTGRGEDAIGIAELQISDALGVYGDDKKLSAPEFSIYPNPTEGIVNIFNSSTENYSYKIYSISGKLVSAGHNIMDATTQVDMSGLSKGLYIIKVNTAETSQRHKVIIK